VAFGAIGDGAVDEITRKPTPLSEEMVQNFRAGCAMEWMERKAGPCRCKRQR